MEDTELKRSLDDLNTRIEALVDAVRSLNTLVTQHHEAIKALKDPRDPA